MKPGKAQVGVYESLLVYPPNTLDISDVEGVLRPKIPGMFSLNLSLSFFFLLRLFQRLQLRFGQHNILLGHLRFQCFESVLERSKIVANPYRPDSGR